MTTFTSKADINAWVEDRFNNIGAGDFDNFLIDMTDWITSLDHPLYGADWSEWLDENVSDEAAYRIAG